MDTLALLAITGGLGLLAVGGAALLLGGAAVLAVRVVELCRSVSYDTRNGADMPDSGHVDPITGYLFREGEL
jgi:hypothetical protein